MYRPSRKKLAPLRSEDSKVERAPKIPREISRQWPYEEWYYYDIFSLRLTIAVRQLSARTARKLVNIDGFCHQVITLVFGMNTVTRVVGRI